MQIVGTVFSFIAILAVMVGLWWSLIGIPVAIVLTIIRITKKDQEQKKKYKKYILWSLAGIVLLIGGFVLFFILSVIFSFFGVSLAPIQLPRIPTN